MSKRYLWVIEESDADDVWTPTPSVYFTRESARRVVRNYSTALLPIRLVKYEPAGR